MRRAALQAFRALRRPSNRTVVRTRSVIPFISHATGLRSLSSYTKDRATSSVLTSSMHLRRFSIAVAASAVVSGVYYSYRSGSSQAGAAVNEQKAASASLYPSGSGTASASMGQETESKRRAIVIDQGQLYSGTIEGPLSKETDDAGRRVLEMLTADQATQMLRKNEESWLVGRGKGVVRYDVVQIPSNYPIEDDHAEKTIEVPVNASTAADNSTSNDWMFWGVFDGHSGWITSAKLRQSLISFVARELDNTYKKSPLPSAESIDEAIKKGFLRLDNEIVHDSVAKVTKAGSKRIAAEVLAPALSGSCALLSFYDSQSKLLRVACTGDSRAVLGRRGTSGKWTATALSVDQTGGTPEEVQRLRKEHPNEPQVCMNGRILGGLEPSRAFGDAFYKWSIETQNQMKNMYFGRTPSKLLKTPPYVTAEPVVTTTKVRPEQGDFVVMATDGLWEMLTNEEVVGLVGQWLEAQANGTNGNEKQSWLKSWTTASKKELPVEKNGGNDGEGQRAPIRQKQWGVNANQERFIVEDKNAATHLVRNALGGRDSEQVCALLTLPSPYSRRYRDDLTVEVIFFGEGENTGNVELNKEASALATDAKAKL
ncbi:protein phosphatase [Aulographum hederae CBS 113979]|uniref:Protein phosphatase n=1 Tax=Aulographum hederae CBS 113979 TaxID=1176131 RepID=A0A6G1H097_9PEZI|nr:protein phosphatase [Aulographum hederae CBS 113979]